MLSPKSSSSLERVRRSLFPRYTPLNFFSSQAALTSEPGIRDAIDDGNWELTQKEIEKVAGILSYASRKLNI